MKKKDDKGKEGKQKIDYVELINKNLSEFKMTVDYSGYQFTRLDLSVSLLPLRPSLSTSCPLCSRSSSTLSISTSPATLSLTLLTVTQTPFSIATP